MPPGQYTGLQVRLQTPRHCIPNSPWLQLYLFLVSVPCLRLPVTVNEPSLSLLSPWLQQKSQHDAASLQHNRLLACITNITVLFTEAQSGILTSFSRSTGRIDGWVQWVTEELLGDHISLFWFRNSYFTLSHWVDYFILDERKSNVQIQLKETDFFPKDILMDEEV